MVIKANDLQAIEMSAFDVLSRSLQDKRGDSTKEYLRLTGLEVLGWIAVKVALPIVIGMIRQELYDKYKKLKNKQEADAARRDLLDGTARTVVHNAKKDALVAEAAASLQEEGIAPERARAIADEIFDKVSDSLHKPHQQNPN